jgi:hypothetical protein
MIDVKCPNCGRETKAADDAFGKKTVCPRCRTEFIIGAPFAASSPAEQAIRQSAMSGTKQPKRPTSATVCRCLAVGAVVLWMIGSMLLSIEADAQRAADRTMGVAPIEHAKWFLGLQATIRDVGLAIVVLGLLVLSVLIEIRELMRPREK